MSNPNDVRKSPSGPIIEHPDTNETLQNVVDQSNLLADETVLADNAIGETYYINNYGVHRFGFDGSIFTLYQGDGVTPFLIQQFNEAGWWGEAPTGQPAITGNIGGNTALASLFAKLGTTTGNGFVDDSALTNQGPFIELGPFLPQTAQALSGSDASIVTEAGSGSPAMPFIYMSYPPLLDKFMDWTFQLPLNYVAGTTILVSVYWISETTPGNADFQLAFGAMSAGDAALSKSLVIFSDSGIAATNGIGKLNKLITSLSGADLDNAAPGDWCNLRLGRLGSNVLDTLTTGAVKVLLVTAGFYQP